MACKRRRPLSWAWFLPVAVAGLEGVALVGPAARGGALVLLLLSPTVLFLDRRIGSVLVVGGACAVLGSGRAALSGVVDPASVGGSLRSRVVPGEVRGGSATAARTGRRAARLEIEILDHDARDGPQPGDGLRLSIGHAERVWSIGDRFSVRVKPRPARGFCNGGRDRWARWLRRRGIQWTAWTRSDADLAVDEPARAPSLRSVVRRIRGRIARGINARVKEPAAGVLRALVVGDKSGLSSEVRATFARTGTAHLLAVSGMHLALVAGAVFWCAGSVLVHLPAVRATGTVAAPAALASLVAAAGYAAMSGGAVATLRALLMTSLVLGSVVVRRRSSGPQALLLAIGVLVLVRPEITRDLSFQLSVAAVAALLATASRLRGTGLGEAMARRDGDGWLRRVGAWAVGGMIVSGAASIATAPIVAYAFGLVSLIGVVANLILGPLVGVGALALGLVGAGLLPWLPAGAAAAFSAAGALIEIGLWVAERLGALPWAAVPLDAPPFAVVAGVLAALAIAGVARSARHVAAGFGGVALVLALVWWIGPAGRDVLRLIVLDVGQGDAVLLQSPQGGLFVVDAGGLGGDFDTGAGIVLPAIAARPGAEVRAIILSHADRDHYGGLRALVEARPGTNFWWNGRPSDSGGFGRLVGALDAASASRRVLDGSAVIDATDDHLEIVALHPPPRSASLSRNDASLVLGVRYGATRVLLPGDVEARGERFLWHRRHEIAATVVKVPHHGSRTSSTRRFVDAVRPSIALASLGTFNRFGFPAPEVVARYGDHGAHWRATGTWGALDLVSDGQLERVGTCRSDPGRG